MGSPIKIGRYRQPSMYAGAGIRSQTRDLILHLQLSTLQLRQREIVYGWMLEGLGDFVLKRLVSLFKFEKLRRCSHVSGLLASFAA